MLSYASCCKNSGDRRCWSVYLIRWNFVDYFSTYSDPWIIRGSFQIRSMTHYDQLTECQLASRQCNYFHGSLLSIISWRHGHDYWILMRFHSWQCDACYRERKTTLNSIKRFPVHHAYFRSIFVFLTTMVLTYIFMRLKYVSTAY